MVTTRQYLFLLLGLTGCNPELRCPYGVCDLDTASVDFTDGVTSSQLVPGDTITCSDPSQRDDIAFDQKRAALISSSAVGLKGGGVLAADFNSDGLKDVVVLGSEVASLWVQDASGGYTDVTSASLPQWGVGFSGITGGSVVDIDADGDFDVYVTVWGDENRLWINDGEGHFESASSEWVGYEGGIHRTMSSAWADMDGDDDLDLVLGGFGPDPVDKDAPASEFEIGDPVILLENLGDGTFADVSDLLPTGIHDGYQSSVAWFDLDEDGRQDLIVSNNYAWVRPGDLIWNTPDGFVSDEGQSGFTDAHAVFGLGVGDLNGDGSADFVRSGFRGISVLTGNGATWDETASVDGIIPAEGQAFGWGVVVEDFNNNGRLDAMMSFGYWEAYSNASNQPNALFIQGATGMFTDEASAWGCDDDGFGRGLVATDLNGDGWMDTVEQRLDNGSLMQISRCGEESWIILSLEDEGPNRFGIGARIEVTTSGNTQTRWLTAGGFSAFAASSPEAHFGLGNASAVTQVTVTWPDGKVDQFEDVAVRQHAVIRRSKQSE